MLHNNWWNTYKVKTHGLARARTKLKTWRFPNWNYSLVFVLIHVLHFLLHFILHIIHLICSFTSHLLLRKYVWRRIIFVNYRHWMLDWQTEYLFTFYVTFFVNSYILFIENTPTLRQTFADHTNFWSNPGIEPYHCANEAVVSSSVQIDN